MKAFRVSLAALAALLAVAALVPVAHAQVPDVQGSVTITEQNGFGSVCSAPCYIVQKDYEVWLEGNPGNPLPLAGNNTYIYTLHHLGGAGPTQLGIIKLEVNVPLISQVTDVGYVASSPGTPPAVSAIDAAAVRWQWTTAIPSGGNSTQLYIHSPLLPGLVTDNIIGITSQGNLATPGTSVGPFVEPQVAECDIDVMKAACVVQPPSPGGDDCQGKVTDMVVQYTGEDCSASSHLQRPWKVWCFGDPAMAEPVRIVAKASWGRKVWGVTSGVNVGDTATASASFGGKSKLGPDTVFLVFRESDNMLLQRVRFHTSCSEPLNVGNQFGSLKLTSLTTTEGGTVTLPSEEDCVSEILVSPPPHCKGDVRGVRFRYTGADCSLTNNDQGGGDECTQVNPPTTNPVTVKVANSSMSNVFLLQSGVDVGDIVDATAANGGQTYLPSATYFWITDDVTSDVIQTGKLVTDCQEDDTDSDSNKACDHDSDYDSDCKAGSEPLNLGDTFGALQVFGLDTTGGGIVALGADVEYRYEVMNIGTTTVDSVDLFDDHVGVVPGSPVGPLDPTDEANLTAIVPDVDTTTTNTVTATAYIGGNQCDVAEASATVTVEVAPPSGEVCECKVQKMLLRYIGPDINSPTTVTFDPERSSTVTYTLPNLLDGTVLSKYSELGYTISSLPQKSNLGPSVSATINTTTEVIDTSCSTPFVSNAPAPLVGGGASTNWFVVDFKDCSDVDHDSDCKWGCRYDDSDRGHRCGH
jgi:hypothetical protein